MHELTFTLPPEVWNSIVLGIGSLALHTALQRVVKFGEDPKVRAVINWVLAIGLPLMGSLVVAMLNNADFIKAFPAFPVIFTTAQVLYFGVVRAWRKAWEVDAALQSGNVDAIIVQGGADPIQQL